MDLVSSYAQFTQDIVEVTGMSRPMLHVHAGMGIYLLTQFMMRERRSSLLAVVAVAQIEAFNEIMNYLYWGSWRWADTSADIALTLFWPITSYAVGTYRRMRWGQAYVRPIWGSALRQRAR